MIHCRFVGRTYYNPGNGYTVASYHTREELPPEVVRQNAGNPGTFQAYGIELPTGDNLEVELDGAWKKGKYGFQLDVSYFHVDMGFSLLSILEFFVFRKTEICETIIPLLCGGRQEVIHKNHLSSRIIEVSSHY